MKKRVRYRGKICRAVVEEELSVKEIRQLKKEGRLIKVLKTEVEESDGHVATD